MAADPELDRESYCRAVGLRVRYVRTQRRMSQLELAETAGLSLNQIGNIERNVTSGRRRASDPHLTTLYRIAGSLHVPVAALLPAVDVVPPPTVDLHHAGDQWAAVEVELDEAMRRHGEPASDGERA